MKKRLLSGLLSVAVVTVLVAGWQCGCAFAELPQRVVHDSSKAGDCHGMTSQNKVAKQHDTCCPTCQLQEMAIFPSFRDNVFLQLRSLTHQPFSGTNQAIVQSVLASEVSVRGDFRTKAGTIRVSSSETPIYIQQHSLLI